MLGSSLCHIGIAAPTTGAAARDIVAVIGVGRKLRQTAWSKLTVLMTESEITDLETLRRAVVEGLRVQYLVFWGHTSKGDQPGPHVLSQWWPATFEIDDEVYSSAEQYMMAEKVVR